jgi:hypothetical protein
MAGFLLQAEWDVKLASEDYKLILNSENSHAKISGNPPLPVI